MCSVGYHGWQGAAPREKRLVLFLEMEAGGM